jgi:nascent polypeptide-associated complex subunit beta
MHSSPHANPSSPANSGKGTPRRKVKKVHKSSGTDDKKLQASLKKLNVQPIAQIEEVNMFKEDGNVIHFSAPKGTPRFIFSTARLAPPPLQAKSLGSPFRVFFFPITANHSSASHAFTVHASVPSNTFAIYGAGEDKELTELVPGILNQLGPDSLASLRKLAESYQSMQKKEDGKGGGKDKDAGESDDDDDIPDLVEGENFESKVE